DVPALVGRDDADVLAAGLRALARAARDAELELVRRAQAAVAQLELDGHAHRVLDAVPAPRRPDARLHRAQRLAVGVPGLEARVDEAPPDVGELLDACTEHVDPLAARDLGVEAEVARDLAHDDES